MQLSHDPFRVSAVFDDPNLVSCAGLAPVVALADRAGLRRLVAETVTVSGDGAANAPAKVAALVAGMVAGADSIDDMGLLRHGGMARLFTGIRAPSTLGTFLRTFAFGHVRQLDAVAARVLAGLARCTPLLPGADQVAYVDIDDTVRATHGYAKQGAGYGYSKVKGLNVLLATISTPLAAPVIAATRLRKGSVNSVRGAAGWSPTPWSPPARRAPIRARGRWSSCARTAPTTAPTSSPPPAGTGRSSPSPRG